MTNAIQWKGDNLKEVIEFTGKHKSFDRWFPNWEAYERRVKEDGNLVKLIGPRGNVKVHVGDWIVKQGYLNIRVSDAAYKALFPNA